MQLNPQQIELGRGWLKDYAHADWESDVGLELIPVPLIESEIRRQYPGGIDCFLAAGDLPIRGADAAD